MQLTNSLKSSVLEDLKFANENAYSVCGFKLTNCIIQAESREYDACSFQLNSLQIHYRASKITPTKTGQFVTIWKRNDAGITVPFDVEDAFDFIVISSRKEERMGQFIFPKTILHAKKIIAHNGRGGKRGMRVYPPWDQPTNKQASQTQAWQLNYFVFIEKKNANALERLSDLLKDK